MLEVGSATRVYLRKVRASDRRELIERVAEGQSLLSPWISAPATPRAFRHYLRRTQSDDHEGLLVCRLDSDAIVGVINLNNIVRGSFLSASLGYYAISRHAGQGYMREGLELVKHYAFRQLGLHRIEANIQPTNQRSINLVKRCGFVREGFSRGFLHIDGAWRDHERWVAIDPRTTLTTMSTAGPLFR